MEDDPKILILEYLSNRHGNSWRHWRHASGTIHPGVRNPWDYCRAKQGKNEDDSCWLPPNMRLPNKIRLSQMLRLPHKRSLTLNEGRVDKAASQLTAASQVDAALHLRLSRITRWGSLARSVSLIGWGCLTRWGSLILYSHIVGVELEIQIVMAASFKPYRDSFKDRFDWGTIMIQMLCLRNPRVLFPCLLSNHWSDHPQILNLSLADQAK